MSEASQQIRLASTPAFAVGSLQFEPATRQLMAGGERRTLEPRVMQVIALLASANGQVVGRDEMIDRCWDGRIVGEQSINRVIAIIRKIGAAYPGSFTLETIPRVGYLLKGEGQVAADQVLPAPSGRLGASPFDTRVTRRAALGAAAGLAGVAALGWRAPEPASAMPPEAKIYMIRGQGELDQMVGGYRQQAIANFRRATELAPNSAEAWGALAIGYARTNSFADAAAMQASLAWTRGAAERARALDPGNVNAVAAMILVQPYFRRWAAYEAACRALLETAPNHAHILGALGTCLAQVGRWRDATAFHERVVALHPESFSARLALSLDYWQALRMPEAEASFQELAERWPSHAMAQSSLLSFYAFNGRLADATRVAETLRGEGRGEMVATVDLALDVSRAVTAGDAKLRREILAQVRRADPVSAPLQAAKLGYLSQLGAIDDAFDVITRYHFGGSAPWRPGFNPRWPLARSTALVLSTETAAVRADPRFATVTRALGLDDYWRATASRPDYRA